MLNPKSLKLNCQSGVEVRRLAAVAEYLHRQGYQLNELARLISVAFDFFYDHLRPRLREFESDSEALSYLLRTGFAVGSAEKQRRAILEGLKSESLADNEVDFRLPKLDIPANLLDEIRARMPDAIKELEKKLNKED